MRTPARAIGALAVAIFVLVAGSAGVHTQTPALPTPESSLGFRPGADYKLATYEDVVAYFQKLDAASDRMTMVEAGTSTQGRTYHLALISSPENLKNIARLREISRRLAHPEGLSEADARALAREGKAFVHIDGGLHATEVAGPQQTPQLAYDILSRADEPDMKMALDNVVLMLWPTINPDGQTMVAEWYRGNVGTPYEVAPLPRLYQEYVGHDNNRDGYMINMIESRVMEHAWRAWEPQIIHVHHQTAPFPTRIWLPPFAEPIASRVPYLLSREVNMIGMAMAKGLEERGQVGATHMGTGFDAWYPGYIDYKPMLQNIASFWTETALYSYATPRFYTPNDFPADMRDLRPESLYSSPWPGGWWRLRDAVEYMETASLSVIDWAARYKDSLLLNRYKAGRQQIEQFRKSPPYAYVVPQQQRDPVAAVELLRRLAFQGVRVSQLASAATIDGVSYAAGTWVVPMDQEFAETARQVLEVQKYPELRESPDGPLEQPYDAAGWTLPYQMGVQVAAVMTPMGADAKAALKALGAPPSPTAVPTPYITGTVDKSPFDSLPGLGFDADPVAAAILPPAGKAAGTGPLLLVDPAQNNAYRAINRVWKAGGSVRLVPAANGKGARFALAGVNDATITEMVSSLALQAERAASATGTEVKKPRIGLYRPWMASMDEGWTRWILEQYGFTFVNLVPADFRGATPLADRIDVLVIADEARGLLDGYAEGVVPPQYVGGIGTSGVRAIDAFVRGGGSLVCFNRSALFAIEQLHLPVKNAVGGLKRQDFFTGGSIVSVEVDPTHALMAGMPDRAPVFVDGSPVFETLDGFKGEVLAKYQAAGSPLMSGYLTGEKYMNGKAAALSMPLDRGRVVLVGFRPQWRGQPFGTFRVIFNAVLNVGR
ncbi:MAG: M14 metallopeptidase family protein [Vicinamibacterales bacterium]